MADQAGSMGAPALDKRGAIAYGRRVMAVLERIPTIGWIAILSVILLIVYGTGYVGYDASFTLVWAKQILHGHLPAYGLPQAPTPHPLTTAYCVLLSLFPGTIPLRLAGALGLVYYAILGVVSYKLGERLFSRPVGVIFALIVLTRPRFVEQAQNAAIEIPWLALIVGAAAMEVRRPRRGLPVLGLLAVAGLLRPETWLLTAAYTVYLLLPQRTLREGAAIVATALVGPVLWVLTDIVLAHDPLFSLTRTQDVGEQTQTARGGLGALTGAVNALGGILHPAIVVAAAIGLVYVFVLSRPRALLPIAIAVLGSISFFAIGLSGLPTLSRFFFLPSLMLALFAAVILGAWRPEGYTPGNRRVEIAIWAVVAVGAIVSLPFEAAQLRTADKYARMMQHSQTDLHKLVGVPVAHNTIHSCPAIGLHTFRVRPFLYLWLGKPYPTVEKEAYVAAHGGLLLERPADRQKFAVPASFRPVYTNRSWTLFDRCPPTSVQPG